MSRHRDVENKIYVGDLPSDASEKELERHFSSYGRLRNVWVARNPAGFAFVEFEDHRDAEDAVRGLDGTTICGVRVRVEHSSGKVRPKPWLRGGYSRGRGGPRGGSRGGGGGGGGGGKGFNPEDRCYECNERGHYAYDCRKRSGRSNRSRSRSRSRGRERSRSYERRRSSRRSPTYSRSRSRSPSKN